MVETNGTTDPRGLEICRACLGLRGPVWDGFSGCERTQRCACEAEEARWRGYDFNRAVELCRGCDAALVRSGSRWSLFFCDPCKARVMARNRSSDEPPIPLGRHTVMNGLSFDPTTASAAERDRFSRSAADLFQRIEQLERAHRERVGGTVSALPGDAPRVPLAIYLAAAHAQRAPRRR